jgi:SAM-dependent methyltransferase
MTDQEIKEQVARYKWYHTIQVTENIFTPGWDDPSVLKIWDLVLRTLRTIGLDGKRVLDIGCRDGLFSFEAERYGAREVIGIDNDLSPAAVEFLIPVLNSKVQMVEMNLYELTPARFGTFDVVCFAGVLYHLRYPFWGLKLVRDVLNEGGHLVLHTSVYVDDNRLPMLSCPIGAECPGGDPTNVAFFNLKGLVDTLWSLGITVDSVEYILDFGVVRPPRGPSVILVRPYNFDEGYYRQMNADLNEEHWSESGFRHYELYGRAEGRPARLLDGTVLTPASEVDFGYEMYNEVVLACRKTSEVIHPVINGYLEGKHAVHSEGNSYLGPVEQFPRAKPVPRIVPYKWM